MRKEASAMGSVNPPPHPGLFGLGDIFVYKGLCLILAARKMELLEETWLGRGFRGLRRCFPTPKRRDKTGKGAWRWLITKEGGGVMNTRKREVQKLVLGELIIPLASKHG